MSALMTMHVAGGIALVLMAVMASALAGYLAARLRIEARLTDPRLELARWQPPPG